MKIDHVCSWRDFSNVQYFIKNKKWIFKKQLVIAKSTPTTNKMEFDYRRFELKHFCSIVSQFTVMKNEYKTHASILAFTIAVNTSFWNCSFDLFECTNTMLFSYPYAVNNCMQTNSIWTSVNLDRKFIASSTLELLQQEEEYKSPHALPRELPWRLHYLLSENSGSISIILMANSTWSVRWQEYTHSNRNSIFFLALNNRWSLSFSVRYSKNCNIKSNSYQDRPNSK